TSRCDLPQNEQRRGAVASRGFGFCLAGPNRLSKQIRIPVVRTAARGVIQSIGGSLYYTPVTSCPVRYPASVDWGDVTEATGMETVVARSMVSAEPWIASRRQLLVVTLIGYLAWLLVFEAVGRFASTLVTTDVTLEIDRRIPFWPAMIWVYELCYLLPLAPPLAVQDGHRFNRVLLAFLLANVVACAAYLVFPVDFPHPVPGAGLSRPAVAVEDAADFHPRANHLPSLHVTVGWRIFGACA